MNVLIAASHPRSLVQVMTAVERRKKGWTLVDAY